MIGFDTSAIIDLFKGDENIKKLLIGMSGEAFAVNQLSYLEIMFGIDSKNVNNNEEEIFCDNFFDSFNNYGLDINSSKMASKIFHDLKKSGITIEMFDCAIAGIFLSNGINVIITKNTKHFDKIKGLKVIGY
jgi:predicted nucleic acid-binding protein